MSPRLFYMAKEKIFPCNRHFCKCIEYLNFSNMKQLNYYKQCLTTKKNNDKFEHDILTLQKYNLKYNNEQHIK